MEFFGTLISKIVCYFIQMNFILIADVLQHCTTCIFQSCDVIFSVPALVPLEPKESNSPEQPLIDSVIRPPHRDPYDLIKCERDPDCPVPSLPELPVTTRRPFYLPGECLSTGIFYFLFFFVKYHVKSLRQI